MKTATGRIRIIKIPDGEAPIEIRQAWVGLTLPCDPYLGYPDKGLERGVLTNEEAPRNRCGFSAPQDEAIAILAQSNPKAATWWKEHGFPQPDQRFGFAEKEAEIVSGVTHQRMIEITDEMQGNRWR